MDYTGETDDIMTDGVKILKVVLFGIRKQQYCCAHKEQVIYYSYYYII
jgi:hypothetical protein